MPKWIEYARVKALRGQLQMARRQEVVVTLSIMLLDDHIPSYANGKCLLVRWPDRNLHIFNPQRIVFSVDKLLSHVQSVYGKCEGYSIVEFDIEKIVKSKRKVRENAYKRL